MAAYLCSSCDAKFKVATSFCPKCGQPTSFATVDEIRQWDLDQWRRHQDEAAVGTAYVPPRPLHPSRATQQTEQTSAQPQRAEQPSRAAPHRVEPPHAEPLRAVPARDATSRPAAKQREEDRPRFRLPRPSPRKEEDVDLEGRLRAVVESPQDYQFIYEACTECDGTDWILRTGRNEDQTYNYWCVRCSRSFKTDLRLPHGRKPFIVSGSILALLALLTNIL